MDLLAYVMGIIISDPRVSFKTKTIHDDAYIHINKKPLFFSEWERELGVYCLYYIISFSYGLKIR